LVHVFRGRRGPGGGTCGRAAVETRFREWPGVGSEGGLREGGADDLQGTGLGDPLPTGAFHARRQAAGPGRPGTAPHSAPSKVCAGRQGRARRLGPPGNGRSPTSDLERPLENRTRPQSARAGIGGGRDRRGAGRRATVPHRLSRARSNHGTRSRSSARTLLARRGRFRFPIGLDRGMGPSCSATLGGQSPCLRSFAAVTIHDRTLGRVDLPRHLIGGLGVRT